MPNAPIIRLLPVCMIVLAATLNLIGCSKKEAATPPPAPTVDPAATVAPVAPTATPVTSIPASTDIQQSFADADAALKAKAYEKAVQAMLAAQQQRQLTDQQAQEARNRMVGLQQSLAAAVANGDPSAKAAVEMLRRSSMAR